MVISNLNTTLITDRLSIIIDSITEMKALRKQSNEEFFSDKRNPRAAESYLRHTLGAIFDIGRHILAKTARRKTIEYKEIARLLGKEKIIPHKLTNKLIPMAGYRNRLTHFYHEITDQELYEIINKDLEDIEEFVKAIQKFLVEYKGAKK